MVPPWAALFILYGFYMAMHPGILFSRKAIPDLVPMAEKRTEG